MEGTKGLFFVGQPHHMRLWLPVLRRLEKEGMEIVYLTAHAYLPFEASALPYGIQPVYIEDFMDEKELELEERIYVALSAQISEIQKKERVFNLFSPASITETLRHIIRETILFEKFLREKKIDIIFALHELNRWSKILAFLSFKLGIPFVTLQEGAYYTESFSLSFHTEYSTANLVWGEQTVDLLRKLGNAPEKSIIVGDTHLDTALPKYKGRKEFYKEKVCKDLELEKDKPLVLIIGGVGGVPLIKVISEMEKPRDINFVLKLHPGVVLRSFAEEVKSKFESENFKVLQHYNPYDLLVASDVCVSLGRSTLTFEALAFDKPIIELEGEMAFFSKYGVALVANEKELARKVREVLDNGVDGINYVDKERLKRVKEYIFYKLDCKATDRVIDVIKFILKERSHYKRWNLKVRRINFKFKPERRFSFNLIIFGNVRIISETLNVLLDKIDVTQDEINLIFPEQLKELYNYFKSTLKGRGVVNFHLSKRVPLSLSALYNFGLSVSKGNYIFLFKEGLIPLKLSLKEEIFSENSLVGGVVIDSNNKVKHLGIVFEHNNVVYRLYEDVDVSKVPIKFREYKAIDYVIAGGRAVFSKLGAFDERMADYYSVIDYSLSAYYKGVKNVVSNELFFGLMADLTFQPPDPFSHIRFYTKWRGKTECNLQDYLREDGIDILSIYEERRNH